jgi:putative tryptophan/tyrosine transport system permease protein
MSAFAFFGAVELGLVYAFVALGVFLSFRVLDFPDLTVDGSFPLGAAVAAVGIVAGWNPWLATGVAMVAGAFAGFTTAFVSVRFRVLHLLASILTMIALFSINLRIMGRPNIAVLNRETMLTPFYGFGLADHLVRPLFILILVAVIATMIAFYLKTDLGLALRATGANPRMARAQGVRVGVQIMAGVALSNALVALAGALFAQTNGFADVTAGIGTIVVGLAAVIVGETLLPRRGILLALAACVLGSVLYRLAVQLALELDFLGLTASDLNLATALLVLFTLILPRLRQRSRLA